MKSLNFANWCNGEVSKRATGHSTPDFSTMNSSTPDLYGVEGLGVEMSCKLLEGGHFNSRILNHELFNPKGVSS